MRRVNLIIQYYWLQIFALATLKYKQLSSIMGMKRMSGDLQQVLETLPESGLGLTHCHCQKQPNVFAKYKDYVSELLSILLYTMMSHITVQWNAAIWTPLKWATLLMRIPINVLISWSI